MIKPLALKQLVVKPLGLKPLGLAAFACVAFALPALADGDIEYPATVPDYPFQRSYLTPDAVVIPPYRHVFRIRLYSTPQRDPYYNVPPYPVLTPY